MISNTDLVKRKQMRGDMTELMSAAVDAGAEATNDEAAQYVISGEKNLLGVEDLSTNMGRLRQLFDLFERKTGLMQLLDHLDSFALRAQRALTIPLLKTMLKTE